MKLEEMEYTERKMNKTLCNGVYKGFRYVIQNKGRHPTAYICLEDKPVNIRDIKCHGGVTYTSGSIETEEGILKGFWVGWDYGSGNDFVVFPGFSYGSKKWTTEEIIAEVKEVIDGVSDLGIQGNAA